MSFVLKRVLITLAPLSLLLIPFVATQFTPEVDWSGFDFLVMGALLLFFSLLIQIALRLVKHYEKKVFLILALIIIFLLTWAELGVGIFGTPFAGD